MEAHNIDTILGKELLYSSLRNDDRRSITVMGAFYQIEIMIDTYINAHLKS